MIAAFIGILAGGLGLTSLIDQFVGTELTSSILSGLWAVLQFCITPIVDLFLLIWDKLLELIRSFIF